MYIRKYGPSTSSENSYNPDGKGLLPPWLREPDFGFKNESGRSLKETLELLKKLCSQ